MSIQGKVRTLFSNGTSWYLYQAYIDSEASWDQCG